MKRGMSDRNRRAAWIGASALAAIMMAGCLDLIGYRDHVVGDPFGTGGGGGETGGAGTTATSSGGSGGGGGGVCEPGEVIACYSGPAGTDGKGICQGGQQTCNDDGLGYGKCEGEVVPATETCGTAADDDCNGSDCALWATFLDPNAELDDIAVDGAGNTVIVGSFTTTMSLGGFTLQAGTNGSFFVGKLDPAGNVAWAKAFGDSQTFPGSMSVAVDPQGAVILAGSFDGTLSFGGELLTSSGQGDVFTAKLAASGAHQWSGAHGDDQGQGAFDVKVDALGDVLLVGTFRDVLKSSSDPACSRPQPKREPASCRPGPGPGSPRATA